MTTDEYKQYKNIKKENLKDNMTNMELVLNMLAEVSATEISKVENPVGLNDCRSVAKRGGNIAGNTRKELESVLDREIITKKNSKTLKLNEGS